MNNFSVRTDENGIDFLYEKQKPIYCLTKDYVISDMIPNLHIISVREAKIYEIFKWKRKAFPDSCLITKR
jgi:hypothetical protein